MQPTSGDDRSGRLLNVAWGTGTFGGPGLVEVLRLTLLDAVVGGASEPLPLQFGFVSDSRNPTAMIALPPFFSIPEPSTPACMTIGMAMLARRRRDRRVAIHS